MILVQICCWELRLGRSQVLTDLFPAAANIRGTLEFDTPLWGQIAALGIRATPAGAFTTIPVMTK